MTTYSNVLYLPFRKTTSQKLSTAIKQYILSEYNQHPDMFVKDLAVIDTLRQDAVQVREPHFSGVQKIIAYTRQLVWIGRKFPVDLGVDFIWFPALGYSTEKPIILNNLKFELANICYNLAALYSQLAVSSNRNTAEGLKMACNYFCLAAGVIRHISANIIPEIKSTPPEDMDESTLECLQQLLLAQAQECFWQKAVVDGYRDASIAKLAAKTSDLYGIAGDCGMRSDAISSEWIHHTVAKHHHFAAAAQYRQALDCLEKRKYGEEVARLRDSIACVQEGLKEARHLNNLVLKDMNSLNNKVSDDLRKAEKDNDLIYLCPVPPKSELKNLERANMAISKTPVEFSEPLSFIGDQGKFGTPLFSKLVPFAVHIAETIYVQRRDHLINTTIISPLEALTTKMHSILSSLTLPGSLQALEKPLGLPPTLSSHAEEIRQSDAVARLQRSFSETSKLAQSAASIYAEARSELLSEGTENERLKLKYGTDRWSRLDSPQAAPKLYSQLDEIDGYLNSAASSDHLVLSKFKECEGMLRILSGSDSEISKFVPNSRYVSISPILEEQVLKLRNILNELSRMESRRRKKIESLLEMAKHDNINASILAEAVRLEQAYPTQEIGPAHFEGFFENRLSKYDSEVLALKTEEEEQDQLLNQLKSRNEVFVSVRKRDIGGEKDREKALQGLENAYFQYKEVISNLEVGRKFYNDLGRIVGRYKDDVKAWVLERRREAVRFESELNLALSCSHSLDPSQPQRQQQNSASLESHDSHERVPLTPKWPSTKPLPQKATLDPAPQKPLGGPKIATWNPDIGIKFAGNGPGLCSSTSVSDSLCVAKGEDDRRSIVENRKGGNTGKDVDVNRSSVAGHQTWDPQRGLRFG